MSRVDGWRRGWFPLGSIPGSTSPRSGPRQYPASPRLINLGISNQKNNELGRGNKKRYFWNIYAGLPEPPIFNISGSGQIPAPTPTTLTRPTLRPRRPPTPTLTPKITLGSRKNNIFYSRIEVGEEAGQKNGSGSTQKPRIRQPCIFVMAKILRDNNYIKMKKEITKMS